MLRNTSNRWLAFVYAATIFVSAFLLFQIQPMISKAILPWFGGTPAVWTICLLFFQSLLFAGYAYAHFTNAWLKPGQQAVLHILVIIAALALLYFMHAIPNSRWQPRGDADPTRAILLILAITIGLPYFVLSATGPLLQAWFARSFPGRAPYRLYALSNVGSLLALLSFPFLFERQFDLTEQASLWSAGFIAFAILCAYAAWRVRKIESSLSERGQGPAVSLSNGEGASAQPDEPAPDAPMPSVIHYFLWLLLPAFASVVLMATTNHISTDVAVVPLLWVVPLALYLLTFIIAFDRPAWYRPITTAALTLVVIYPTAAMHKKNNSGTLKLYDCAMTGRAIKEIVKYVTPKPEPSAEGAASEEFKIPPGPRFHIDFIAALFMNFATMFGICLLCHGQLARLKPHSRYLTAYYLMIAAGGAVGGIIVSLIAPHVFQTIYEWKLAIFAAAVVGIGIILYALVGRAVTFFKPHSPPEEFRDTERNDFGPPRRAQSKLWPRLLLAFLLIPFAFYLLDLTEYLFAMHRDAVYESRNFFGALTISELELEDESKELTLLNGTTVHGTQFTSPEQRRDKTSYYSEDSGVGLVLNYFHANRPPGGVRIGDVGLGAGTIAAYAEKFDHVTFYEINPAVIDIATSGEWFTFVPDARARGAYCDIRLGDARLTLQRDLEEAKRLPYHVLVLDAFSGDAVPTHLLTAEAMKIYLPHVATEANMGVDGALLIHVSNRYLDLHRVARGAAEHIGFECVEIHNSGDDAQSINSADWVVLTRNKALLAALVPHAAKPDPDEEPPVLWTDAHSSLFEILR